MRTKKLAFVLLISTLCFSPLVAQDDDSYTLWLGSKEIFTHHNTDVGDTIEIKRSLLSASDTLYAQYYHMESHARGTSTRVTLKNEKYHILRGDVKYQHNAYHKASIPVSSILSHWKLSKTSYLYVSLVVHTEGRLTAHGFRIGVLKLVD